MATCKHTSAEAAEILKKDKILGAALRAVDSIEGLTIENGFVTNESVAEVTKMAEDAGFMYHHGKGFFYTNELGETVQAAVNQIHKKVKENYGKYTNTLLFSPETAAKFDAIQEEQTKQYNDGSISKDPSTINSIDDLKEASMRVVAPAVSKSEKYEYNKREFYRTTSSLGFGVAKEDRTQVLENAAAAGNFLDELGKRIFAGYAAEDMTYEKINEFIKQEAFQRASKDEDIEPVKWLLEYKDPISREGYEQMVDALVATKQQLQEDYNIKEFHTDINVWDNDTFVAGEVDVLAELEDGTFTVIDLKSRKDGLSNYAQEEKFGFNDKSKHTMQTNTYSNMMMKMGFNMNAPVIVISQPVHPKDSSEVIHNSTFAPIQGDDILAIVPLERREGSVVNFNVGERGAPVQALINKYKASTSNYELWLAKKKRAQQPFVEKVLQVTDKQKQRLQDRLKAIQESLIGYQNISKSNLSAYTLSEKLGEIIEQLGNDAALALDENLLERQIQTAGNFFAYAAEQLNELHGVLNDAEGTQEERMDNYLKIMNYTGVFKTAQELFEQLETMKHDLGVDESDTYEAVKLEFSQFASINANLSADLKIARRTLFTDMITEAYLGSKGEIKMNNKLRKEAEALYEEGKLQQPDGSPYKNKKDAIESYLNAKHRSPEYLEDVKRFSKEEVDELVNNPSRDISKATFFLNSDIMVNNDYVQYFHKLLMNAEQQYSSTANEEVVKLSRLHAKLGLNRRQVEELIVTDFEGNKYLMSDYDIEFFNIKEKFRKDRLELNRLIKNTEDLAERSALKNKQFALAEEYTKWFNANTEGTEVRTPIDKWKTDYSALSTEQQEALKAFKDITVTNETRIGTKSLIKSTFVGEAKYYKLPGVLRTQFGHAVHGSLVSMAKKAYDDMTKIELDDTEEGQESSTKEDGPKVRMAYTGLDGKPSYHTPIFFRSSPKERQNTDLFTIYAMELQNGIRYEIDSNLSSKASIFLDTVKGSKFFATTGIERSFVKSVFSPSDSKVVDTLAGDTAVVVKMIEKMMKARVYSITQEYGGEVMGKDINRLIGSISSYTTFAAMSFKGLSAGSNWITGNVAMALEAAGGEFATGKAFAKAKAEYYANVAGIVGDMGSPVKRNRVNQMISILDVRGERDVLNNEFERTNKIAQHLKTGSSLATYSMGEHEIHATVMLAILHEQKVINGKGQFLDKEGKIVTSRDDAASMSDAFVMDEHGVLQIADWAEYSEFDPINKLKEGGLASIRDLIKDRVTRTQGAFDSRMQADLNRHWYGKLFFQFKKHMPPQILNRFRGSAQALKSTEDIQDADKYFNLHSKTEEYGYYVSFVRFLNNVIKQERFNVLSYMKAGKNEWRDMTKHERANVKKTFTELSYIIGTFLLAGMAAAAADDDDEALWALTYLLRRQTNEGGLQYLNPMENWRVVNSPMAALGKLQNFSDTLIQLFDVTEEYDTGEFKGENKLKKKLARTAIIGPVLDQFEEGYAKKIYGSLAQ